MAKPGLREALLVELDSLRRWGYDADSDTLEAHANRILALAQRSTYVPDLRQGVETPTRAALREIVADYRADEDAQLGATLDQILALVQPAPAQVLDREAARAWLMKQFGLPGLADEITEEELDALAACVKPALRTPTADDVATVQALNRRRMLSQRFAEERARADTAEAKLAAVLSGIEAASDAAVAHRIRALLDSRIGVVRDR